jgi:putative Mn2+ efflux pump MntP
MDTVTLTGIALSLSFDTFAVSLSCGIQRKTILFVQALKIAVVMALFQGGLPVAGYFLGSAVSGYVEAVDHWIAFAVLLVLGVRMIIEGVSDSRKSESRDITSLNVMIALAIGTSIDAFAVGVTFAFLDTHILYAAIIIGAVTFIASMVAIRLGKSAGSRLGTKVEVAGGIILIIIGIKILYEHLYLA